MKRRKEIDDKSALQKFSNFVIFQTKDGKVNIDVYFQDETLWLTQKLIAELFEKGRSTITEHLKKIFADGELDENMVCRNFRHTTQHGAIEGKTQIKDVKYYNLRAITAVGYRVNSHRTITGKTAAEIIYTEADAKKIYMGLKTWKQAPNGKILKSDISIAENYLNQKHLKLLEQIVTAYLDMAENRARNKQVMNMKDWDKFLIQFLELADYPILKDKGKVSMLEAKLKAESEYDKYRVIQDKNYISDFDREISKMMEKTVGI